MDKHLPARDFLEHVVLARYKELDEQFGAKNYHPNNRINRLEAHTTSRLLSQVREDIVLPSYAQKAVWSGISSLARKTLGMRSVLRDVFYNDPPCAHAHEILMIAAYINSFIGWKPTTE